MIEKDFALASQAYDEGSIPFTRSSETAAPAVVPAFDDAQNCGALAQIVRASASRVIKQEPTKSESAAITRSGAAGERSHVLSGFMAGCPQWPPPASAPGASKICLRCGTISSRYRFASRTSCGTRGLFSDLRRARPEEGEGLFGLGDCRASHEARDVSRAGEET